jgi:adenylate cyclase class 2
MEAPSETEVKLRIRDRAALRARLQEIGASLARERHFEDNVLFDDASGSLRAQGSVLRLRRTPHGGALTFKGPRVVRDGLKIREEREIAVEDPQALDGILRRLGYRPVFRYQKYRESWLVRAQKVEIDDTPIGAFVEIEGDPSGIRAVAAELGYGPEEYVSDSYVALFLAGGGQGDMVFEPSRP